MVRITISTHNKTPELQWLNTGSIPVAVPMAYASNQNTHIMKEIKNVEGEYFSTYAFVHNNKLENIAEEVLGKDWEAEDDVAQIQAIIEYMNIGKYSVTCSEFDSREDDIIVTKIKDTPIRKSFTAEMLLNQLLEMKALYYDLSKIQLSYRYDSDSDVEPINYMGEGVYDAETNNMLEELVFMTDASEYDEEDDE